MHNKASDDSMAYNYLFHTKDGMIENSRRKLKNLDAAIICSRRPGYFSHYKNTDRVAAAESKKELILLAKKLQVVTSEIMYAEWHLLDLVHTVQDKAYDIIMHY